MCHAGMERKRGLGVGRRGCALSINRMRAASPDSQPVTARGNGYYNPHWLTGCLTARFELNRDRLPCSDIANGHRVAALTNH